MNDSRDSRFVVTGQPSRAVPNRNYPLLAHYTFVDYLTQGYILLVGLIILFGHNGRTPSWPMLLVLHAAALVLIHSVIYFHARRPANPPLDFLRHCYPILCYAGFYHEATMLNQLLYAGYVDPHFLRFERSLFGWEPGLELMNRFPSRWVSEVLYASYFSYYLMIGGVALVLLARNRRQFAHFISSVSLVFYTCYLIFIFMPVVGPRILCPGVITFSLPPDVVPSSPPATPESVANGVFFQLMAWIYDHTEIPGAAFPSSHVAVAVCTVYFSFLYLRPIRWVHLGIAVLLCIATVYGRYHYVVDVVAGGLLAAVLIPLGNRLFFKFHPAISR
jgi:membrane-associated phospholipid phosphatase